MATIPDRESGARVTDPAKSTVRCVPMSSIRRRRFAGSRATPDPPAERRQLDGPDVLPAPRAATKPVDVVDVAQIADGGDCSARLEVEPDQEVRLETIR